MLSVTLRRLHVFVSVAETGSFAATARRLGIAQPSVSAHIKSLERDIADRLFERQSGRPATLTEAGQAYLLHAQQLLADATRLTDEMGLRSAIADRRITLSCQRSLANSALRRVVAEYAKHHRDLRVSVQIGSQEEVLASVSTGQADVGLLLSNAEPQGFDSVLVGRQRFLVVAAPDHPLARRKSIPPAEVAKCDFVGPPPKSAFGNCVRELLGEIGIKRVRIVSEATEFAPLRELAAAGLGLFCTLAENLEAEIGAGRLVALDIDGPDLYMGVRLVLNRRRAKSRALTDFSTVLRLANLTPELGDIRPIA